MNRDRVLELSRSPRGELEARFGVKHLALIGSTARDSAKAVSDVDLLVTFDGPATSKRFFGTLFFIEDLLGCPVDLVTDKALRAELRPYIEVDSLNV